MNIHYRSFSDLAKSVRSISARAPKDIDLVVANSRSGVLVANLFSLHLNSPFIELDDLIQKRTFGLWPPLRDESIRESRSILLVDDSVTSGSQMAEAREDLQSLGFGSQSLFCAPYVTVRGREHVDYWHETIAEPHVWGWEIINDPIVKESCVDMDGVLCRDPTSKENDDGERYEHFIATVDTKHVPRHKIGWIVTARLEKYRDLTEAWLRENGIEYGSLIMLDLETMEERKKLNLHGEYKATVYESTNASLFIESDSSQAREIAERTSKNVFCVSDWDMIKPSFNEGTSTTSTERLKYLLRVAKSSPGQAVNLVRGHCMNAVRNAYSRVNRFLAS